MFDVGTAKENTRKPTAATSDARCLERKENELRPQIALAGNYFIMSTGGCGGDCTRTCVIDIYGDRYVSVRTCMCVCVFEIGRVCTCPGRVCWRSKSFCIFARPPITDTVIVVFPFVYNTIRVYII